jgi:hypothetical protein
MIHSKTDSMTTAIGRHRPWVAVLVIAGWCFSAPALAIEDNEVRGEIVEVMPDDNRLRLDVTEAGAARSASAGSVETYEFDQDTTIRMEDSQSSVLDSRALSIGDLQTGTRVRLNFEEIDGRRVVRDVNVEQEQASDDVSSVDFGRSDAASADSGRYFEDVEETDMAAMETSERDRLPATASILPLMAIFGAGFAGLGLLLRLRRR